MSRQVRETPRLVAAVAAGAGPGALVATAPAMQHAAGLTSSSETGLLVLLAFAAGTAPLTAHQRARLAGPFAFVACGVAGLGVAAGAGGVGLAALAFTCGLAAAATSVHGGRWWLPASAAGATVAALSAASSWRAAYALVAVASAVGAVAATLAPRAAPAGDPAEARRRVLSTPTLRRLLTVHGVLGVLFVPLAVQLALQLAARGVAHTGQALAITVVAAGVATGASVGARRTTTRRAAATVVRDARRLAVAAGVTVLVSAALPTPLLVAGLGLAAAAAGASATGVSAVSAASVPPALRPLAAAFAGVWSWVFGVVGGLVLAATFRNRFGEAVATAMLAAPVLIAVAASRRAQSTADADVLRVEIDAVQASASSSGRPAKLLDCTGIDFSYGPVQVLFDVAFGVDDGEMVALLGTNGAGKSTLLRVVSGLGIPSAGSVRFRGEDITFLDPDRRLRRGIAQIPGGKAVFGPMTVTDNLRAYGYTHGRDRAAVDRGIEASFEAFPRLHERRHQQAGTLSGGEQQMLALSKVFILRPRLLLIDELSLGLAPKVVGELLEMVRRINATGTAVVLVEQSVNVALSLVHHAYFMEKGAVQFDGPAADLLDRADLLRSVFLEGAAKGLLR